MSRVEQTEPGENGQSLCLVIGQAIAESATELESLKGERGRLASASREKGISVHHNSSPNDAFNRLGRAECVLDARLRMLAESLSTALPEDTSQALTQISIAHGRIHELKHRLNNDLEPEVSQELDLTLNLLLAVTIFLEQESGCTRADLGLAIYCYPRIESHEILKWARKHMADEQ